MNSESTLRLRSTRRKRPKLVWVIAIFYFISVGWTLFSFVSIYSGLIPVNEAQAVYFESQTIIDILFTIVIGLLNFVGAIFLFLLRRSAFHLFLSAFVFGLMMTVYHIMFKNWLAAIGGPGIIGAIIGWGIAIATILYARKLIRAEILN